MPGTAASDELGALSRSFSELLERLREHTEYLRTLASKLSHELRTPLAVVTTSLDNLEHEVKAPAADEYLQRLRQGTQRLDGILAAMSEATELEQAIRETPAQPFDLAAVVASCCAAYRDVYAEREIALSQRCGCRDDRRLGRARRAAARQARRQRRQLQPAPAAASTSCSPRPGARSCCPSRTADRRCRPRCAGGCSTRSFRSASKRDGRPHLGLGLHIVALVADFHGGRCEADDLPDGSGVVFRVWFPRSRDGN